ncbi:hypothetical protein ACTRLV_01500 [Corynebacterium durum]|nr:hypothetical protein [Corynebacterium durum]NYI74929.1 hypothetical protein [Corynebacterium durum]
MPLISGPPPSSLLRWRWLAFERHPKLKLLDDAPSLARPGAVGFLSRL